MRFFFIKNDITLPKQYEGIELSKAKLSLKHTFNIAGGILRFSISSSQNIFSFLYFVFDNYLGCGVCVMNWVATHLALSPVVVVSVGTRGTLSGGPPYVHRL